jgi:hypothetical protein
MIFRGGKLSHRSDPKLNNSSCCQRLSLDNQSSGSLAASILSAALTRPETCDNNCKSSLISLQPDATRKGQIAANLNIGEKKFYFSPIQS